MNLHGFKFFIFINNILFIGAVSFYFNETYNEYTLIMPLADDDTRGPLTVNSSRSENWCSNINATLPIITDETEQKNIVDFIRNATQIYTFDRIQTIFVNKINHTVGNWTWVNGQPRQGFTVQTLYSPEAFFGYLPTDYLIFQSLPNATRGYICEASKPSNNFSRCHMKLDNRCYWKKYTPLTWHEARNVCLKEGGDFASFDAVNITGLKDSLKDLDLRPEYTVKSYWIGLSQSVWRWKEKDIDSEIKYSNWKLNHSINYNATCLCLDKSNSYEWIGCDCDKEYPFICKRNVIAETSAKGLPKDSMLLTKPSAISETSAQSLTKDSLLTKSPVRPISDTSTQNLPMGQIPSSSEAVRLSLVLCSCVIIILVVAAVVIWKQRNRPVNSSRYKSFVRGATTTANEIPVYATVRTSTINESTANCLSFRPVNFCSCDDTSAQRTTTVNVIPIFGEIEEARGTQSTANWSASKTTYAIIQPVADTSLSEANTTEYANLDLPQRKK